MYTEQDIRNAAGLNLFIGGCLGVVFTLGAEVLYAYYNGWIW